MTPEGRTLGLHVQSVDGGTLVTSPQMPELNLFDRDRSAALEDLLPAVEHLWLYNKRERVRASVIPAHGTEPVTTGLARLNDSMDHKIRIETQRGPRPAEGGAAEASSRFHRPFRKARSG